MDRQMHFQDDVVLHQWGIVRHGNLVQSYHCKSQEWNRHLWKHWEEWREDHPWLEVSADWAGMQCLQGSQRQTQCLEQIQKHAVEFLRQSVLIFLLINPPHLCEGSLSKASPNYYSIPSDLEHHHVHLSQGYDT